MNVIRALEQLKTLLPGDTPNKSDGEYCFESFDHFVSNDEPELALNAAVYIAETHHHNNTPASQEFWSDAKRIAVQLATCNQTTTYCDINTDITRTIDQFLILKSQSGAG
jgi:hypothetical protein